MENKSPKKLFVWKSKHIILLCFLILFIITTCDGLKFINRAISYNKRSFAPSMYSSRLETKQESANTEDSGSIFDDQTVVVESTSSSSTGSTQNSTSTSQTSSTSSQDEKLSHMMSISEPASEEKSTVESPSTNATITSSEPKTEQPVMIKYVSSPNGNDYQVKEFESDILDEIYPSETDDMVTYGLEVFAIFIGILLTFKLFIVAIKNMSYFQMSQYKMKAIYSFLRDLTILIIVLAVLIVLNYHHYLDFIHTNMWNILYGFAIFILIWITTSGILLYTSFLYLKRMFEFESVSKDISKLNDLKRFYEELWMNNKEIHSLIKDQIQFQMMRQSFISPIELPVLTESFLRRDFNFTMYLGYCISDYLGDVLGFINIKILLLLMKLTLIYREIKEMDDKPQNAIFYSLPFILLIILFLLRWHLRSIFGYLVPEVSDPEHINFHVDLDVRDPFEQYGNLQIPPYLEKTTSDNEEELERKEEAESEGEDEDDEFEVTKRPKKSKPSALNHSKLEKDSAVEQKRKSINKWILKSGKRCFCFNQNRHQRLFCCGRCGLFFTRSIIQGCYVAIIVWLAALITGRGYHRYYVFDDDKFDVPLMIVCILVALFTILIFYPTVVYIFALDTSIQMMKRRDYIEIVIKEQKYKKSLRSKRMYQVFKLIRRELIDYFDCNVGDKKTEKHKS